jgi:catechol 2,3-dioxygenase-like lactoylglutathione lyase family enzyme
MEGTKAMNSGLQFIVRHVADIDAARVFYTEKMGFEVQGEQPGFVQFKAPDGASFAISLASADPVATELPSGQSEPLELWWYVDDADAAYADLRAKGVEVLFPPKDMPFGRAFAVQDPTGARSFILQPPR